MTTDNRPRTSPRVYYGWIIVGLGFTTLAFQVGYRFSFAIFQVPLITEFGWSRGLLGGAFSLSMLVYAASSPYIGSLLEKWGPRAIMPWGCVIVGVASLSGFFITSIWHVYLLIGLIGGIGVSLNGFATNTSIMPRWFVHKRGRATGMTLAGIGIGILIILPLIERMIFHWGWRMAFAAYGAFILIAVAPASFLIMRNRPEDVGQSRDGFPPRPDEEPPAPEDGGEAVDKSVRSVFRTLRGDYRFWMMMFLYFSIGFNNNTIISQLALYFTDIEFSTAAATLVLASVGFLRTGGSVAGGWMGDRIGRGHGAAVSAAVILVGLVLLLMIPRLGVGLVPAYTFALIYGLGVGSMSTCCSALGGDIFEGPTFGVIVGFTEICYGLGGVVGPPLAGFFFDYTGSYTTPFSMIMVVIAASIVIAVWLQSILDTKKTAQAENPAG
jgi:MFS family permease